MSWLKALILGIVQGLTEFLPVSSSGHLELGQALLGTSGEENLLFAVVVHAATVLSTLVILWREVAQLFKGTFTTLKWNQDKDYVAKILISMIPVFVVGMFFKDQVEAFFGNGLIIVGVCLITTAFLLGLSEFLTMRMNRQGGRTAADVVNRYDEEDLARVLYLYGELKQSRQLARRLVQARAKQPIETTEQLVTALLGREMDIQSLNGGQKKELTLVFQALRIEVNDELGALRMMLTAALDLLKQGGRMAVLTYHSLEDRLVKNFFKTGNLDGTISKDFYGNIETPFRIIEKGLTADAEEVEQNPRARSAKLRIAEKR